MSDKGTIRAFVAVALAPAVTEYLEATTRALLAPGGGGQGLPGKWGATAARRMHLTLRFLGDIPPSKVEPVVAALEAALRPDIPDPSALPPQEAFDAALGGWILLPRPIAPRVLAVGVSDGAGNLPRLADHVAAVLDPLGFPVDDRPFLAHITAGRRRDQAQVRSDVEAGRARGRRPGKRRTKPRSGEEPVTPPASFPVDAPLCRVDRVCLVRSELRREGAHYTTLHEVALAAPAV